MTAHYIVRLDDACPTMRREIWDPLEQILDQLNILPIVGVIPENRDPSVMCSLEDPDFWGRVRRWERKGWTIAMHGLHHEFHAIPPSSTALLPLHSKSEFVGLTLDEQKERIARAYSRFVAEGIRPKLFMAPSHTFDINTLGALREETDIRIITDGYALGPYRDGEFIWIPQQLWRFRWMPLGIWSVCLHPNTITEDAFDSLVLQLRRFERRVIAVDTALESCRGPKGVADSAFAIGYSWALRLRRG
jgi:predicted deacetylase